MKVNCVLSFLLMSSILACTPTVTPDFQKPQNGGENSAENYTPEISTDEDGYDGETATDQETYITITGDPTYWENVNFQKTVKITYSGNTASVSLSDETIKSYVTGADVAIDLIGLGATEIVAEGASDTGQIKIDSDSPVKLSLNGLKLTSDKSAVINFQSKSVLYLHMCDGTENIICDASSQSDESYYPEGVVAKDEKRNGALYCKGSLVLSGTGVLQITGMKKHGLSVKSSVTFRPGVTISVNDVADNCVKAEGITILGGYLWAKTSADAGKCLSSDADENDTSSSAGIKADGNIHITGGEILCVSSGEGGKGINVDGNLTIDEGKVEVVTSGGKYVYNAAQDLDSSPKDVRAEGNIVINGGWGPGWWG